MLAKTLFGNALILTLVLQATAAPAAEENFHTEYMTEALGPIIKFEQSQGYFTSIMQQHALQRRQVALPADPFFDFSSTDVEGKNSGLNVVEGFKDVALVLQQVKHVEEAHKIVKMKEIEEAKLDKQVQNIKTLNNWTLAQQELRNHLLSLPLDLRLQLKRFIADDGAVPAQVLPAVAAGPPAPTTFIKETMNSGLRR